MAGKRSCGFWWAVYTSTGAWESQSASSSSSSSRVTQEAPIYRCALWHSAGQDSSGSMKERDLGSRFWRPWKSRTLSTWVQSTKFCAMGNSGSQPMFTIPWVGKAGFKSLCSCRQWPSLAFKAALRLTPWVLWAPEPHKGNPFLWKTPRRDISFWFRSERHRNPELGRKHVFTLPSNPRACRCVLCFTKWQFPASGNGLKLTNKETGKHEHIWSPAGEGSIQFMQKCLLPR